MAHLQRISSSQKTISKPLSRWRERGWGEGRPDLGCKCSTHHYEANRTRNRSSPGTPRVTKRQPRKATAQTAELFSRKPKRWRPRRLTSAPASIDTVAAFRPWRDFRPSVARGRRGHHRDGLAAQCAAILNLGNQGAMNSSAAADHRPDTNGSRSCRVRRL